MEIRARQQLESEKDLYRILSIAKKIETGYVNYEKFPDFLKLIN